MVTDMPTLTSCLLDNGLINMKCKNLCWSITRKWGLRESRCERDRGFSDFEDSELEPSTKDATYYCYKV